MAFSTNFNIPEIDNVLLNRLLRKDTIAKAVKITRLILISISAIATILIIKNTASALLHSNTQITEIENQIDFKLSETTNKDNNLSKFAKKDYQVLKAKNIFGEIGVKPVNTKTVAPPPKVSNLALNLIGTFITPGTQPFAIIENKKESAQEIFNIGNNVFNEAELISISPNSVEIKRNGQIEILKLDDTPDAGGTSGASGASGEQVIVAETDLNKALENLPLLLTQARAVPYFKDGQAIGLRLFAIKTGSLYEQIGLRNGDILKTINGNNLGDITQAVKLFEKLKTERSVNLTLERNRQEQSINYQIR
jgi:type II secretion system protein C